VTWTSEMDGLFVSGQLYCDCNTMALCLIDTQNIWEGKVVGTVAKLRHSSYIARKLPALNNSLAFYLWGRPECLVMLRQLVV